MPPLRREEDDLPAYIVRQSHHGLPEGEEERQSAASRPPPPPAPAERERRRATSEQRAPRVFDTSESKIQRQVTPSSSPALRANKRQHSGGGGGGWGELLEEVSASEERSVGGTTTRKKPRDDTMAVRKQPFRDSKFALKPEEMLELDKAVRMHRHKPTGNVLERIEYLVAQYINEQEASLNEIRVAFYKAGIRSIWLVPKGNGQGYTLFFGTPDGYATAMGCKTVEDAIFTRGSEVAKPKQGAVHIARGDVDEEEVREKFERRDARRGRN